MAKEFLLSKIKELETDAERLEVNLPLVKSSSGKSYYAKIGNCSETEQYRGEIESLKLINLAAPSLAPRVLSEGLDASGRPFCISEYKHLDRLTTTSSTKLAGRLATELHMYKSDKGFGFEVPTFCGPTRLTNGWFETWEGCYDALIGDLLQGLMKRTANETLCEKGEAVRRTVIPYLLRPLKTDPVLLHGDLWVKTLPLPGLQLYLIHCHVMFRHLQSGNVGTDKETGEPVIFDPSSFFGHNEADLAIARIFGGFPQSFFSRYHELHPISEPADQYDLRVDLYELFHYLNHALIFGGSGYASSAMRKMDRLLRECP